MAITTESRPRRGITSAGDGSLRGAGVPGGRSWLRRSFRIGTALVALAAVLIIARYQAPDLFSRFVTSSGPEPLVHKVQRGGLVVTVTEDGNVESANNVDIKCEVAGGSIILSIVPDGEEVKKGDKLVELDKSQIEDQINQQKITYEKARSAMIQAQKNYEVAKVSVQEYLEGTYKKELQDAQAQITISEENLRSAQNTLQHSERMFRRGYISALELEGQQFAVQRAQLELDSAQTAQEVLEKFTRVKMLEDLQSKVETAQAQMESEKAAFELETARLKRLEEQLSKCVINAPQDGMVVYANEPSRERFGGGQTPPVEEGAQVRENQTILRLPDLKQMQVKVNVHETKVEQIRRNMRARIKIQDREFQGTVLSIANQPQPGNWWAGNVKEYATTVRIDGQPEALKPGMTAEVEILVAHLKDILTVPVAAIVELRGQYYCWVKKGHTIERRPLVLGVNNDQFVQVNDGVQEGDQVLLNPRAVVSEARGEREPAREKVDVEQRFGNGPGPEPPRASGPASDAPRAPAAADTGPSAGPGASGSPDRGPNDSGQPRRSPDVSQLDSDGDGKISKDEAPPFLQNAFDQLDRNADGFLDAEEQAAMRNRARGAGRGGRNLLQLDRDGDGRISREEAADIPDSFFQRLDSNGDGFVDRAELEAIQRPRSP